MPNISAEPAIPSHDAESFYLQALSSMMKLSPPAATESPAPHLQTTLYRARKAKSPFRRTIEQILLARLLILMMRGDDAASLLVEGRTPSSVRL